MWLRLPMKMKTFYVTMIIISVYLFLFYLLVEIWFLKSRTKETMNTSTIELPFVVLHLDLKGAAPKLEYLESLLPMMKHFGANGLLIEYEDMFPYEGKLTNLSATFSYRKNELRSFITLAVNLGFEVIPLVQTFGHLEFALKLLEFTHLREDPLFPDSICPSRVESAAFVRHMLEQVIQFHNEIHSLKYIHIGGDEVFHVKKCERCRHRHDSKMEILLQHLRKTVEVVKVLSPNTTVMIWDDVLQARDPLLLDSVDLQVEPVSWCYKPSIDVSVVNFYKYPPNFKDVWVASAFKGADGSTSVVPDLKSRLLNNLNWIKLILEYNFVRNSVFVNRVFNFKGIILTGWSRYSHMDALCDILPASVPSLIVNLIMINKIKMGIDWNELDRDWMFIYEKYVKEDLIHYLGCDLDETNDVDENCKEEIVLYRNLTDYVALRKTIINIFHNGRDDIATLDYYFKLGLINMNNVNNNYFKCNESLYRLLKFEKNIVKIMSKFYKKNVVDEYVNTLNYYYKNKLWNTMRNFEDFAKIRSWNRKTYEDIIIHMN